MIDKKPTWVFGYGSLIWNPGFVYEEKVLATFIGWERKFWQGSEDHRGVPGAPGRVVTLVPGDGFECRGMAFRLHEESDAQILAQLDVREKGGYEQVISPLHLPDGTTVDGITYIASIDNPMFLGDAPVADIVRQIAKSVGPSGANSEYLFELASAFRQYGIEDSHVFELETALRNLQSKPSD